MLLLLEGFPNQPMARPFSRHGRYDARKESISSEELPSVSVYQYPTPEDVCDVNSYTMFERPKTSHGRRASTGNSVYHEAKPVRREYQYSDKIDQVSWDKGRESQNEEQTQGRPISCDQEIEFHHRNQPGQEPIRGDVTERRGEGFERPASRRGYPHQGRQLIDYGLDNPRRGSFDENSYLHSQPAAIHEPPRKSRPKSAKHGSHKKAVFDVPIMRPPSSLTRFQPLPSIGSKPEQVLSEMDRLVLHPDKLQLDEDYSKEPISTELRKHGRHAKLEVRSASNFSERASVSQHHKPYDHEFEQRSKLYGFEYKEDFTSGNTENRGVHQEKDWEGNSKKGDPKMQKSWSKHSPRSLATKDKSLPKHQNGKFRSSSTGDRKRQMSLSPEPSEDEPRLLLAVKLPDDGRRFQRYFRPSSSLNKVILFAELSGDVSLSDYLIACNAPRKVFTDYEQTCEEIGLQDRTLLYFEKIDS